VAAMRGAGGLGALAAVRAVCGAGSAAWFRGRWPDVPVASMWEQSATIMEMPDSVEPKTGFWLGSPGRYGME
jgi:hypothetical protein